MTRSVRMKQMKGFWKNMQCTQILTKNRTIVYSDAGLRFLADLMGVDMPTAAAVLNMVITNNE